MRKYESLFNCLKLKSRSLIYGKLWTWRP